MLKLIVSSTIVLFCLSSLAQPAPVSYTISGASPPVPALKYRLLPDLDEQTPGNAAPVYLNGALLLRGYSDAETDQVDKWTSLPLEQFPVEEARKLLEKYSGALAQFDIAARREECRWDNTVREQGFMSLLPHLTEMRKGARLISLRARLQIVEKRWDDACYSLRTGMGLSQHLQGNSLLIEALVGQACGSLMMARVREWSSVEGSPNLYWALTNLPRPMSQITKLMETEQSAIFVTLPPLRGARGKSVPANLWPELIRQLAGVAQNTPQEQLTLPLVTAKFLPRAKAWMIAQGKSQKEVDAMPAVDLVGQWCVADFIEQTDELNKWFGLPYWQGIDGLRQASVGFEQRSGEYGNPLFMVVPAVTRAYTSITKFDREIAAMQTVEAIRAHVAAHGSLPGALDELRETPSLLDPMTGKQFGYSVSGKQFTIESVQADEKDNLKWQISLR